MRREFTQKDEKIEMLLVGLYLLGVIFLYSGWAAVACLVGAGVMGWRWKKQRSLSIREGVLLALFLLTAILMIVTTVVQMAPTRHFEEVCRDLFTNPQQYRAIDREQNDVTEEFVENYRSDYEQGRTGALREAFVKELSAVRWVERSENREQGKIYTSYQLHVYLLDYLEAPEHRWFEQLYIVKGEITQDSQTGEVLEYSNPSFYPGEFYSQGGIEGKVYGVSLGAEPTEDGKGLLINSSISILFSRSKLPRMLQMVRSSYGLTVSI